MNNDTRPIGVFDSGLGGISVLSELIKLMPNENFIYFGDSANAPYGVKSFEEVARLTTNTADMLINRGCKALVIACNTATVAAVTSLRNQYTDIPIIGIEPALKPAVLANPNGKILVMATHVTLNQNKFLNLMKQYEDQATIHTLECPGIVEFVERGEENTTEFIDYLNKLLADYIDMDLDAVVLGCTHYPFVKKQILSILNNCPSIYDGGNGTARETLHQLQLHNMTADKNNIGRVEINNSDPKALPLCEKLLANYI